MWGYQPLQAGEKRHAGDTAHFTETAKETMRGFYLSKETETEKGGRNQALMVPQATAGAALPFYFTCDVTQLLKTSSSEIFCSLKSKVTQLMSGFHILREPPS